MKYSYLLILFLFTALAVNGQNAKDTLSVKSADNETVNVKAESMPEYPGGLIKMQLFIRDNLRYPVKAQLEGIVGRVVIQMTVSRTGTVSDYKVHQSAQSLLDQEALRVVRSMPKKGWSPGTVNGESVDMRYRIPITFRLGN